MVSREVIKSLKLPNVFDKGIGALLPEGYKNFYKEWRVLQPQPVHYVPEEGNWKKNEVTGEMLPIQNIPIPVKYPLEYNSQMWGGDGVIQGFQIRDKCQRRVPHFWIPLLRRSVVYSEVLDKHISVILTERTINLINAHYGFDHYLLKTFACDLKSLLPLRLKRKILQELENGCPTYEGNSEKRNKILEKYEKYLSTFTSEDINWYGYTFNEACKKYQAILDSQKEVVPLKLVYRKELIAKLVEQSKAKENEKPEESTSMSWLKKINPFERKERTQQNLTNYEIEDEEETLNDESIWPIKDLDLNKNQKEKYNEMIKLKCEISALKECEKNQLDRLAELKRIKDLVVTFLHVENDDLK